MWSGPVGAGPMSPQEALAYVAAALHCPLLTVWGLGACFVGMYWYTRGLSPGTGFWLSLLGSPPLGLLVGALARPNRRLRALRNAPGGRLQWCPCCGELIPQAVRVCPACYRAIGFLTEGPTGGPQFLVEPARGWLRRALLVREVDPYALHPQPVFPLNLALFIARTERQRFGRRAGPIRVSYLDGVREELL